MEYPEAQCFFVFFLKYMLAAQKCFRKYFLEMMPTCTFISLTVIPYHHINNIKQPFGLAFYEMGALRGLIRKKWKRKYISNSNHPRIINI